MKATFILLLLTLVTPLYGTNQKLGEHIGYLIGEYFSDEYVNHEDIARGIKNYQEGKPPQLEEREFLALFQELALKKSEIEVQESLSASNDLLEKIKEEEGIVEVVANKLYIKNLTKSNQGKPLLDRGIFHISCRNVHGEPLIDTRLKNAPTFQHLDQAIPGFALGVKGMHENDRRTLYIHPSLAYNDTALIIDVELIEVLER